MTDWKGKRVTILGMGRSGLGAAFLLRQVGARPFLSDNGYPNIEESILHQMEELEIEFEMGGHSSKVFDAELVVISPGIPGDIPILRDFERKRIKVISEVELAWQFVPHPVVAVTGSNGKTTTTSMINHLLQGSPYNPVMCGNIGYSFSDAVLQNMKNPVYNTIYVLEVSSFQMERISSFKPKISVVLNLSPDHLDRYDSMDEYVSAKLRIHAYQDNSDWCVYNADDELLVKKLSCKAVKIPFGFSRRSDQLFWYDGEVVRDGENAFLFSVNDLLVKGEHNISNALAALTVCSLLKVNIGHAVERLKKFPPVPHRLEFIAEIDRVKYYNDSKATNLDSVLIALRSFSEPVILIMGGKDKGADFTRLLPVLSGVKKVILIGVAADKIRKAIEQKVECLRAGSLNEAVTLARQVASPGSVVLLSPACASFDMFKNFEERGDHFRKAVLSLKSGETC